ncbi:hypothetical protein ACFXI6_07955 [Streptomyces mirabilis]|uniref:hypothetical protein n=1 Tax=Streptomyces mirabilis TaxID=68239 RepID=UPI0036B925FF
MTSAPTRRSNGCSRFSAQATSGAAVTHDHGFDLYRKPGNRLCAAVAFVDKWPVFAGGDGRASDSRYPDAVQILCSILTLGDSTATSGAVEVSVVPWGLESIDGHIEFEVPADQLISS